MSNSCPNWSGIFADFLKKKDITIDNQSWKIACEKALVSEGLKVRDILKIDSKEKLNNLAEKIYNKYFKNESLNKDYIYEIGNVVDVCNGVISNNQSNDFKPLSSKIFEKLNETGEELDGVVYTYEHHDNILINSNGIIDEALSMIIDDAISIGCSFTVVDTKQNTPIISYLKEKNAKFKILKQNNKSNINISSIPVVNQTPTNDHILSFEDRVKAFVEELKFVSKKTVRDVRFSENHKRKVIVNGKKIDVTKSVSDLVHENRPKSEIAPYVAQAGNTFDRLVRLYFQKGRKALKNSDFPEFNSTEFSIALKIINHFDSILQNTEGIGLKDGIPQKYKVISQEFDFTAKINDEYVSGTPDLIIYTESGDYFICDIKTVGLNSGSDFNKRWSNVIDSYKEQVSWYNVLMQQNELGKAAGVFFFPVGVKYDILPNASGIKNGTLVINPGKQNVYSNDRYSIYSPITFKNASIKSVLSKEDIEMLKEYSGKLEQKRIEKIIKQEETVSKDIQQQPSSRQSTKTTTNTKQINVSEAKSDETKIISLEHTLDNIKQNSIGLTKDKQKSDKWLDTVNDTNLKIFSFLGKNYGQYDSRIRKIYGTYDNDHGIILHVIAVGKDGKIYGISLHKGTKEIPFVYSLNDVSDEGILTNTPYDSDVQEEIAIKGLKELLPNLNLGDILNTLTQESNNRKSFLSEKYNIPILETAYFDTRPELINIVKDYVKTYSKEQPQNEVITQEDTLVNADTTQNISQVWANNEPKQVCPVTEKEQIKVSNNLAKTILWYSDQLSNPYSEFHEILWDNIYGLKESDFKDNEMYSRIINNKMSIIYTFDPICDYLKLQMFNEGFEYNDEKTIYVAKNFYEILLKSSKIFSKLAKMEISGTPQELDKSDFNEDITTQEDKEESGKEIQYDIDKRTINVINTMAEDIRNKLSKIILKKYDSDGSIINAYTENSNIARTVLFDFVPLQEVVSYLIQRYGHISDSRTLINDIYNDINGGEDTCPAWLQQIYLLTATDSQLKTQLLNAIRKSESNYQHIIVTQLDKNKNEVYEVDEENEDELSGIFEIKVVNSLDETTYYNEMNKIYRIFASCRDYNEDDDFHDESLPEMFTMSKNNKFELYVDFDRLGSDYKNINFKNFNPSQILDKRNLLKILGLGDVFFEDSIEYLNYRPIARMISLIKKQQEKGEPYRFVTIIDTNYKTKSARSISQAYSEFISKNKEYIKPKSETTVKDGDKTYCTHSDPSFVQDVIDEINGKNRSCTRKNLFLDEDAKYRRARVHYNKATGRFVCSWFNTLNEMSDEEFECFRKCFQHTINTSVDGNQFKDQTPREKEMTLYSNYFMPYIPKWLQSVIDNANKNKNQENEIVLNIPLLHRSRVPVMSDKPADENILYLADDIQKSSLADDVNAFVAAGYRTETQCFVALNMYEYYLYELDRQKSVVETLLFGDKKDDVDNYNINRKSDVAIKLRELLLDKCDEKSKKNNTFKLKRGARIGKTEEKLLNELIAETKKGKNKGLQFVYCPFCEEDENLKQSRLNFILRGKETITKNVFCESFISWIKNQIPSYNSNKLLVESISNSRISQNLIYDPINEDDYQDFWFNDFLACCNILNITVGDLAYYKNTIDLQKRFAQVHAMLIKPDITATFKHNGKDINVSDGTYRSVIISDLHLETKMGDVIISELNKMISDPSLEQEQKDALIYMRNYLSKKDKDGNSVLSYISEATDGQSYAGPTAFFKKLKMLGEDTTELEEALERIKQGKYNIGDIRKFCIQEFKSFIYAPVDKISPNSIGLEQVPTQIKHSEAMILITAVMNKNKTPLNALFEFMEETAYDENGEYNGIGIDSISFRSAVKTGIQGVIDLNGKSYEEALEELRTKCRSNGKYDKHYVKEFSFSRWGKQQEVPAHMQDHMQGMGSQIKILSISNIPENWSGYIDGVKYTKQSFIKKYFSEISKDMELGIDFISKMLGLDSFDEAERNKRLSKLLIDTVKKDSAYNPDLEKALEVEGGKFKIPLQDPVISNIVFKTIFSLIKKYVNKEEMFGGPVVQVSPFGRQQQLYAVDAYGHKFGDRDFDMSHGVVYKVAITAPTEEIENAITVTRGLKEKFKNNKIMKNYKVGDLLSMEDVLELDILTPEQLEKCKLLAYRIPTEDKYSIFRCEIAEFLPRQGGEAIIMPPEVTVLSGCDFDVDKMYTEFLFDLKALDERRTKIMDDFDDGRISEEEWLEETSKIDILQEMFATRNKIFKMQWDMLGQIHSTLDHLHPGNFEILKDLADRVPVKENLSNKSIMLLQTQLDLYALNAAGKNFVGIAALNNISHSICEMANVYFKIPEGVDFMLNGKKLSEIYPNGEVKADPMYSPFDNMKISRMIGMFVGASADNAKEAVLGKLNITPLTANIAVAMMRLGFPLDLIVGILTNDTVVNLCDEALNNEVRFETAINKAYNELILSDNNFSEQIGDVNFQLEKNTKDNKIVLDKRIQSHQIIILLHDLCHFSNGYSHINNITSLNSVKNAVGPNIWDTMAMGIKLENSLNTEDDYFVENKGIRTLLNNIPHLKTLYRCYTGIDGELGLLETLTHDISTVFNPDFQMVLTIAKEANLLSIEYPKGEVIKQLHDDWLIYKAHSNGFLTENSFKLMFDKIEKAKSEYTTENNFLYYLLDLFDETHKIGNSKFGIKSVKLNDIHALSQEQKAELTEGWKDLLNDKKTHELAKDIFKYFMFRFGFNLTSRNALTISPADLRVALSIEDGYEQIFDSLQHPTFDIDSFIIQFMFNHPTLCPRIPINIIESAKQHKWNSVDKDSCPKAGYGIYSTKSGKLWYINLQDESTNLLKIYKPRRLGGRDLLEYRVFGDNDDTITTLVEDSSNRLIIRYSQDLDKYDTSVSEYETQDEGDTTNKNTMTVTDNETSIIASSAERSKQGYKNLIKKLGLSEEKTKSLIKRLEEIC